MSIKSMTTFAAATAAILGITAVEVSAGPGCGTGGGYAGARYSSAARYSPAPRVAYVAPQPVATKPVVAKAAPAARQIVAQATPAVVSKPAKAQQVASAPVDTGSGGDDAGSEKVVKQAPAPAPIRQAAPVKAPVEEAPARQVAQQVAQQADSVETSVSAIAARLAAMSGRRSSTPVE